MLSFFVFLEVTSFFIQSRSSTGKKFTYMKYKHLNQFTGQPCYHKCPINLVFFVNQFVRSQHQIPEIAHHFFLNFCMNLYGFMRFFSKASFPLWLGAIKLSFVQIENAFHIYSLLKNVHYSIIFLKSVAIQFYGQGSVLQLFIFTVLFLETISHHKVPKWYQNFGKILIHSCVLYFLAYQSTNDLLIFCKNCISGKNLALQLWSKNLWTNQNVGFFKP